MYFDRSVLRHSIVRAIIEKILLCECTDGNANIQGLTAGMNVLSVGGNSNSLRIIAVVKNLLSVKAVSKIPSLRQHRLSRHQPQHTV